MPTTAKEMIRQAMELLAKDVRMDELDEDFTVSVKAAWADLHWATQRDQVKQDNSPSDSDFGGQPEFQGIICRGSYALGSACGTCERCAWERKRMGWEK